MCRSLFLFFYVWPQGAKNMTLLMGSSEAEPRQSAPRLEPAAAAVRPSPAGLGAGAALVPQDRRSLSRRACLTSWAQEPSPACSWGGFMAALPERPKDPNTDDSLDWPTRPRTQGVCRLQSREMGVDSSEASRWGPIYRRGEEIWGSIKGIPLFFPFVLFW